MTETSTVTISEALKNHLHKVKGDKSEFAVKEVTTLHDALEYLLDHTYDETVEVDGYEETLDEPVKVPVDLHKRVKSLKHESNARDYEELIRGRANIENRDMGEQPIEVTKI